jgi:hypothetical protein
VETSCSCFMVLRIFWRPVPPRHFEVFVPRLCRKDVRCSAILRLRSAGLLLSTVEIALGCLMCPGAGGRPV